MFVLSSFSMWVSASYAVILARPHVCGERLRSICGPQFTRHADRIVFVFFFRAYQISNTRRLPTPTTPGGRPPDLLLWPAFFAFSALSESRSEITLLILTKNALTQILAPFNGISQKPETGHWRENIYCGSKMDVKCAVKAIFHSHEIL